MAIKATNHGAGLTFRIAECDCGERWELEERRARRLPPCTAVHSRGQPPKTANPRASVRGVGGSLPVVSSTSLQADPNPQASLLSEPRARAKSKQEAGEPTPHKVLREAFCARWLLIYGEAYPFEPKDGSALANMIKRHPSFVERWDEILDRFFPSVFWAGKRHPLHGLANNAREFAGPAGNGVPEKIQAGRDSGKRFLERHAG